MNKIKTNYFYTEWIQHWMNNNKINLQYEYKYKQYINYI